MHPWHDIRARARAARALLGPDYAGAPAAKVLDALARRWDIEVAYMAPAHPLLRGARAAWREEYGLILVDRTLSRPEQLFALAHELGHRACHPGGCACRDEDIAETALPVTVAVGEGRVWGYNPRQAREVEANVFASELLVPAADVRARFLAGADYRALAAAYGVTITCLLNSLVGATLGGLAEETDHGDVGTDSGAALGLDDSQRRAAETTGRRALVDAGPGTGKTRTLAARVGRLLGQGVEPRQILVLTFSNRAADELRERLRAGHAGVSDVAVATFHGFALDILRRFAPQAGLPDDVRVIDETDAALLLEEVLPTLGLTHYARPTRPGMYLPSLLEACSRMRDGLLTLDDVRAGQPGQPSPPAPLPTAGEGGSGESPGIVGEGGSGESPGIVGEGGSGERPGIVGEGASGESPGGAGVSPVPGPGGAGVSPVPGPGGAGVSPVPASGWGRAGSVARAARPQLAPDLPCIHDNSRALTQEQERLDETLRLLAAYEAVLESRGLVDYGGLIARAVRLLREHPAVTATLHGELRHVLVDEYQDVNRASAVLLRELVRGGADLWVVGDMRQSIYRFRGAAPENMTRFEEDFPGAERLALEVNYRAVPALVAALADVAPPVTGAPAVDWVANRAGAPAPDAGAWVAVAPDERDELEGIARDIARSMAAGRPAGDHAVLCRTHGTAATVAATLERAGLASSYLGAFFLRPEVKDMLALLELCAGPDGSALLRLARWPEYHIAPIHAEDMPRLAREQGLSFPAALHDPAVSAHLSPAERAALGRLAAHVEAIRHYPDSAAVLLHYLFGEGAAYLRRVLTPLEPSPPTPLPRSVDAWPGGAGVSPVPALDRDGRTARRALHPPRYTFPGAVWEGNSQTAPLFPTVGEGEREVRARQALAAIFQLVTLARGFAARPALEQDDGSGAVRPFLRYVRRLLSTGELTVAQATAPSADAVNVLTVHASKGLEFPVVYVPGLVKGRFPLRRPGGAAVSLPALLRPDSAVDQDDERNLFFVALSRARDRLVLSRPERLHGRVAAPSEFLGTLQAAHPLPALHWPAVAPDLEASGDQSAMTERAGGEASDHEIEAMVRCPRQHRYRARLGLQGSPGGPGYRTFARLLREGVGHVRESWSASDWLPTWRQTETVLGEWWDGWWPDDGRALDRWYRALAFGAYERVYRELEQGGIAPTTRFGERYEVALDGDGRRVGVWVDVVEERDGEPCLIWERPSRRSDDASALTVGLYGAVAESIAPERPPAVMIRYLDSGETLSVRDPLRVLERHRPRIETALAHLAMEQFPPEPGAAEECSRCPLVFVCPG